MSRSRSCVSRWAMLTLALGLIVGSVCELGRLAYAELCMDVNGNGCVRMEVVPCSAATCVKWLNAYPGSTVPACPSGGGDGSYFDCQVTATQWARCGFNHPNPVSTCFEDTIICGNYTFYKDQGCTEPCGKEERGFCLGRSDARCPEDP